MNKDKIIKMAFLELGYPYADEDLQEDVNFETASFYFDSIIDDLQRDSRFLFNLVIATPILLERQTLEGVFQFSKPKNFLKNLTPSVEEYGDILVSSEKNIKLKYLKRIDLEDIPTVYERIATLKLALAICSSVGKTKAIQRIGTLLMQEEEKLTGDIFYNLNLEELV